MEQNLKSLIGNVQHKETRKLAEEHVTGVEINKATKEVTLHVDKRYAFNELNSHGHVEPVGQAVKKTFGEEFKAVIQLDKNNVAAEREKAVPHGVYIS